DVEGVGGGEGVVDEAVTVRGIRGALVEPERERERRPPVAAEAVGVDHVGDVEEHDAVVDDARREVAEGAFVLDLVAARAEGAVEEEAAAVVAIVEGEGERARGGGIGATVEVVAVAAGDEAGGEEEGEEERESEGHDRSE